MAEDQWRDDERRRWEEDRNRYGGQAYGQGVGYRQSRPAPYYERPEAQSQWDYRPGYAYGRPYGESNYWPGYGRGWWSGENDRYRYGYGEWPLYEGRYGPEDWRGHGAGWAGRGYERDYGRRSWWDRASDEVSSWMGDEEAERRRRLDQARRGYYGRGPRGYTRSDDRIREDVNDRLTDDWQVDATNIEVSVSKGEVTLNGSVTSRDDKRRAEDLAENVSGVRNVQNNLRVQLASSATTAETTTTGARAARSTR
jgi:osmotically-inducible protein OsmY